ncbi:hypothetical protein LTR16_009881, partial [Cryomyces antarcticus]
MPVTQPAQSPPPQTQVPRTAQNNAQHPLEQELQRMNVHDEPPPAYSSVTKPARATTSGYPNDKHNTTITSPTPNTLAGAALMADSNLRQHPAFANDSRSQNGPSPQPAGNGLAPVQVHPASTPSPGPGPGAGSLPPLPE